MTDAASSEQARFYLRFSVGERLQHVALALSVTVLVITGMPVRYAQSEVSQTMIRWLGGYGPRGTFHRAAALLLLGLALYHVGYLLFSLRGRRELSALRPRWQDLRDCCAMVGYYLSRRRERPAFGRFSYLEKLEYWLVATGTLIMTVTGLVLWLSHGALAGIPKWMLDLSRVIHSYEGLLLFLSVLLWHFYNVHLGPRVFPMSFTWLDGLVEEDRLAADHPLEYEAVRDDPSHWVSGPTRPKALLTSLSVPTAPAAPRAPVRLGAMALAVVGGIMAGVSAPVALAPLLAVTLWLFNPEALPWGMALLCVSVVLAPSAVLGGCLSVALAATGHTARACVLMTLSGLLGLFLGMMSIWIPFAAGVYVVRWFLPIPAVAEALMIAALIVSLGVGLLGVVAGVLRGRLMGERLFAPAPPPEDGPPSS